jgi:DNA adenine methylase
MTFPNRIKPFIKIAGGKTRMLSTLFQHLPKDFFEKEFKYVEPFLGGGSFGLSLKSKNPNLKAFFNEFNFDLYNAWVEIQDGVDQLIEKLDYRKDNNSKEFFLKVRSNFLEYSKLDKTNDPLPKDFFLDRAADFIYLNKTCFNGLIRYNKSGKFNTPYGKYTNPAIYDRDNFNKVSASLKHTSITNLDFEACLKKLVAANKLDSNTLVYMDPPYIPESLTSNFTEYTAMGFNISDHIRMREYVDVLTDLGIKVLISNSDTLMTRKIYKGYKIVSVYNNRSIGARGSTRGKTKEVLIKNY